MYEPSLAELPGQEDRLPLEDLPEREAARRLWHAMGETLSALARRSPLLVLIDDLQWADELTRGAWTQLTRTDYLDRCRLLLVGLYRRGETTLPRLGLAHRVERLSVDRLEPDGVAAMVGDMLAMSEPPPELIGHLVQHSEGIPLFVAEYLSLAVAERILTQDPHGRWRLDRSHQDVAALPAPQSIQELIQRRLGHAS